MNFWNVKKKSCKNFKLLCELMNCFMPAALKNDEKFSDLQKLMQFSKIFLNCWGRN